MNRTYQLLERFALLAAVAVCMAGFTGTARAWSHSARSSSSIRKAEQELRADGYYTGRIDGISGPQFRSAVTRFQRDNNLAATGRLDSKTRQQLSSSSNTGTANRSMTNTSSMLSSSTIESAQTQLQQKGLYSGAIDGVCGPQTQSAIRQFQRDNGLNVSGQLDHDTLTALGVSTSGQ